MKRMCLLVLLALALAGCKNAQEIRPDTIVDIPLRPTDPVTAVTELTEPTTEPVTRPPAPEVPTNGWIPQETTPTQSNGLDRAVAEAINAWRQEEGLPALSLDLRLCAIASVRARENSILLGPVRPDGSTWISVLDEFGYSHTAAGEVRFFGAGDAERIVATWMKDAVSSDTIRMTGAVIGVGSYVSPDGLTYVAAIIAG